MRIVCVHPDELREAVVKFNSNEPSLGRKLSVHDNIRTAFLEVSGRGGCGVTYTNELVSLFSTEKGLGRKLVMGALYSGADWLNCFDGKLVKYYEQFGFKEYHRELNFGVGPEVVYMQLENNNE